MRLIRRLVLLAIVGAGGLAAYNYWSDDGWSLGPSAAGLDGERAVQAARLAHQAAAKAHDAADKLGDKVSQGALTAKIKSKMALDDTVKALSIDVDTAGTVVTLSGTVNSEAERTRALQLARETAGVTSVVDRLSVR